MTIAVVVSVALLIAGIGVSLILRANIRTEAVRQLRVQAEAIANQVEITNPRLLRSVRLTAALEGVRLIPIDPATGQLSRALPHPLIPAIFAKVNLLGGYGQSGVYSNVAYAAIPVRTSASATSGAIGLLVITRVLPSARKANEFLLLVIIGSIVAAFVVAEALTYRFTKPLEAIVATTSEMAKGDFTARVPRVEGAIAEFDQLAESINTMAEKLAESSESERQFLLAISHDLRTPLTSIKGYAEGIADGTLEAKAAATTIMANSERLNRLVGDLLDLAKIRASTFSLSLSDVGALSVAGQMLTVFGPRAAASGIELSMEPGVGASDLYITADPDRLAQVISNLLDNALRYASSKVTLGLGQEGDRAFFEVTDDGPGIAPQARGVLFEAPYQRGDSGDRSGGSGLGLVISAQLIRSMGGQISYSSPPPGQSSGTAMRISFSSQRRT